MTLSPSLSQLESKDRCVSLLPYVLKENHHNLYAKFYFVLLMHIKLG